MEGESLPPPGEFREDLKRRGRRRIALVALTVVTAWALVATGALLWETTVASNPSRDTIWNSDAWLLVQLDWSTGSAASALADYLATHNATFSDAALNWSVQAWDTVRYGLAYGPGGFPSASALNLSPQTFGCTYWALLEIRSYLDFVPGAWSATGVDAYVWYLSRAEGAFSNLSADLRSAGGGLDVDPIVQLGAARVASVRQNASALFALSQPWGRAIIGSDCGS